MPAKLNVDDMDMSPIKIMVGYLSGTFRDIEVCATFDPEIQSAITNLICLSVTGV